MTSATSGRTAEIHIREAVADDLASIRRIASIAFDQEPIHRTALVDLLYRRPPNQVTACLVSLVDDVVVGFAFGSVHEKIGYVDAIAVEDGFRRRGVARALIAAVERSLVLAGARSLWVGGNTWYYAWPGVDIRYTAALCLAKQMEYHQADQIQNMDVPLGQWVPGVATHALAQRDPRVVVRRATLADWPMLEDFVRRQFTEVWLHEARLATHRDTPSVFIATRGRAVIGFACHGVYRKDWFGPIGTDPSERGGGVGETLLRLCLDDLASAGIALAQICWIGPAKFYSRTVGARCGRQFVVFRKDLAPVTSPGGTEFGG